MEACIATMTPPHSASSLQTKLTGRLVCAFSRGNLIHRELRLSQCSLKKSAILLNHFHLLTFLKYTTIAHNQIKSVTLCYWCI